MRVGILVSGRGSNMSALLRAAKHGRLPGAELCVVISNNPDAPALETARAAGIEALAIDHRPFRKDRAAHDAAVSAALRERGVGLVVLAGYMRLLSPAMVAEWHGRMINIHPSLLPAFPGVNAQQQAFDYGVRVAGCTVHFVTEEMDGGPIILQRTVPVLPEDDAHSLAERILAEEHQALPEAVDLFTRGRLYMEGRRVRVLDELPILLATGNAHKVEEITAIIGDLPVRLHTTKEYPEIAEPEETAPDYHGNARIKARHWQQVFGGWALADDSGLEVEALGGRPGVYSSRYAPTTAERNAKLLAELAEVPAERRRARFVCTAVLCGPQGEEYVATGKCEGTIAFAPKGEAGFGYDPLFIPDGFEGAHLAELATDVKNRISHRARALEHLRKVLLDKSISDLP